MNQILRHNLPWLSVLRELCERQLITNNESSKLLEIFGKDFLFRLINPIEREALISNIANAYQLQIIDLEYIACNIHDANAKRLGHLLTHSWVKAHNYAKTNKRMVFLLLHAYMCEFITDIACESVIKKK